jgi:hypothetical protein
MGYVANLTKSNFPQQGDFFGQRVRVYFHYDTLAMFLGTIVRDDMESPWRTIIELDNGRVVLGTECQYSPVL